MLEDPKPESTKLQLHSREVRVSGTLLALFLIGVAIFCPETLPALVNRLIGASVALLAGLFAFFVAAEFGLENCSIRCRFGEIDGKTMVGLGVFLLVLGWWLSPLGPLKEKVEEINATAETKPNSQETVALLRQELPIKIRQIALLQRWSEHPTRAAPSVGARELAAQIPNDADSYALALKSIAQQRFAEARRLLAEAQSKGTDLALLYEARGQIEQYEGHYSDAVLWFEKLLALQPNDPVVLDKAGSAMHLAGGYSEAERLYQRALAITEKTLGSTHPQAAAILTHLAISYYAQGDYEQAEPLLRRALSIQEKILGLDHFNVADSLNNLAGLYYVQGKYSRAEPLLQRAQMILEKQVGSNHLYVAQSLNRLAGLYDTQGKHTKAEPLLQRALMIHEKVLGSNHPAVAASLNNLAELYRVQGKYKMAEPLLRRALAIREQVLGSDHPEVFASLEAYAYLLRKTGRAPEAIPLEMRAKAILDKTPRSIQQAP